MLTLWKTFLGCTLLVAIGGTLVLAEIVIDVDTHQDSGQATTHTDDTTPRARPANTAANGPINDSLLLKNGDRLQGELKQVSADGELEWLHPNVKRPLQLDTESIRSTTLSKRPVRNSRAHTTEVILTNGDVLPGTLISIDENELIYDTWYAKQLKIQRLMVDQILPGSVRSEVVFEGPSSLDEWTQSSNSRSGKWRFKKGILESANSVSVGRDIKIPDKSSIEFELGWSSYPSFMVCFYTDTINRYYGNSYAFTCSGTSIYLQRYTKNGNSTSLGNVNFAGFKNKRSGKFRLLTDKASKTITLFINGTVVKTWTDPNDFAGKGTGLLFYPQSQYPLKVRNISVKHWDGSMPSAGSETQTERTQDTMRLSNNDKITGTLVGIKDGTANFKTEFATLTVPMDRIQHLYLGNEDQGRARRRDNDVRLTFHDGGKLTLGLSDLTSGIITGESENFGKLTAQLEAFSGLQFNIYDENADDDSGAADDWK